MNLEWKHVPLIFLSGLVGAGLGWLVSFLFDLRVPPDLESVVGVYGLGGFIGSLVGLAITVGLTVVRAARDQKVGPARIFMNFHGMGSIFLGRAELRADGSYVTIEWFTLFYIPVFPVCRYRVTEHAEFSTPCSTPYTIHEKLPVRLPDAAYGYGITSLILLGFLAFAYWVSR
ncbi:MAG: hypothetical protein IT579_16105 [Verrucomicrobia subdivision 3 bacterium]|nr:hypothetical protein [Limisphaerales bacterium]